MYQLWKIIRRAPDVFDPKTLGSVIFGYVIYSVAKTTFDQEFSGLNLYQRQHTGSYEEELRQYGERVIIENKKIIDSLRQAKLEKLRQDSLQYEDQF